MTWTALTDNDAGAVRELVARAEQADGVAAVGGHVMENLSHGDFLLVRAADNTLVGVAAAVGDDPAELVVDPPARGNGIGRELLAEALNRAGGVWAHGNLPAATALAQKFDLRATRTLVQMRRPLTDDNTEPVWPDGVSVRAFRPGQDEQAFLGVNARAFDWHPEQGRLDLAGLRSEMEQDWFDPAGFFLAVDSDDTVLGFHWTKVHAASPTEPAVGEVYVIGVDPLSPVRRLGLPLTVTGLNHLRGKGLDAVILYVEGDNTAALRLYEGLGFEVSRTDLVWRRA